MIHHYCVMIQYHCASITVIPCHCAMMQHHHDL